MRTVIADLHNDINAVDADPALWPLETRGSLQIVIQQITSISAVINSGESGFRWRGAVMSETTHSHVCIGSDQSDVFCIVSGALPI